MSKTRAELMTEALLDAAAITSTVQRRTAKEWRMIASTAPDIAPATRVRIAMIAQFHEKIAHAHDRLRAKLAKAKEKKNAKEKDDL